MKLLKFSVLSFMFLGTAIADPVNVGWVERAFRETQHNGKRSNNDKRLFTVMLGFAKSTLYPTYIYFMSFI